jgi:hypothetical protein
MQSGPDLDSQFGHGVADGACAANRARRAVKGREEPIACGVYFASAMASELPTNPVMVSVNSSRQR